MGKKIVIIIGAILVLDQLIKIWVKTSMVPNGSINVIDGFFQLYYTENRGMAFGATLGGGIWAKYTLSFFRLGAIVGIAWYLRKLILENQSPKGLLIAVALIFAGATGNLIDGAFYDLIWSLDPDISWNWAMDGDRNILLDPATDDIMMRPNGFMLGSVVDMFQFTSTYPSWMPVIDLNLPAFLGGANILDIYPGKEIFGAIWNFADLSISVGVGLIIFRYRKFFRRPTPIKDEVAHESLPLTETEQQS